MVRTRVVLLNNEIMPYRIPLFAALADLPELDIHVLYCSRRDPEREWELDERQITYPHTILPGVSLRLRKPRYHEWRTIWINPTLFLHLRSLQPDVIIGYEYSVPALTSLLYARSRRRPYVVWTEGTPHSERDLTWGQKQTRRWIIPRARAYLGTSSVACHNLVLHGADPARVFEAPQTHDVARLSTEVDRLLPQRSASPHVVLFVGFLNERKGVAPLLRAFSRVHARVPQARLRLVGSGVLRTHLEAEARALGILPQVDLLGFIQPSRMPEILATSDVFVLPSLEDTFGIVVVEALAAGVPVVCSQFAGVSSHLKDGVNAFIVDPMDTEAVAERILRLLNDREMRLVFAKRGRALARTFRPEHVALRFRDAVQAARADG